MPGRPEYATANIPRLFCYDPADPEHLAAASREGEAQIPQDPSGFAKCRPGMKYVKQGDLALPIVMRKNRQLVGRRTFTKDREDVARLRQLDDIICQCMYPKDLRHPDGSGTTTVTLLLGPNCEILPECLITLITAGVSKCVIVGSRCISASQEAMNSFRVSPGVMAIGEAAGVPRLWPPETAATPARRLILLFARNCCAAARFWNDPEPGAAAPRQAAAKARSFRAQTEAAPGSKGRSEKAGMRDR